MEINKRNLENKDKEEWQNKEKKVNQTKKKDTYVVDV